MSRLVTFDGRLNVKWYRPEDKMPLDDHFKEFPHEGACGIITDVLVLINNEEDLNEEPVIVQLQFLVDHEGTSSWCFFSGEPYHECHAKNIKFWAEVPDYDQFTIQEFEEK